MHRFCSAAQADIESEVLSSPHLVPREICIQEGNIGGWWEDAHWTETHRWLCALVHIMQAIKMQAYFHLIFLFFKIHFSCHLKPYRHMIVQREIPFLSWIKKPPSVCLRCILDTKKFTCLVLETQWFLYPKLHAMGNFYSSIFLLPGDGESISIFSHLWASEM